MSQKDEKFENLKLQIEAILFSYGDEISENEIAEIVNIDSHNLIQAALNELQLKYENGYAFYISQNENNKWKMGLKEEFEILTEKIISNTEMPKEVLKVLSVIAYEQPVTKTRLSEILGKSVKPQVEYLYKEKFVNYEKSGIGKYYRVTKKFYDYFKLDEQEFREIANQNMNNSEISSEKKE